MATVCADNRRKQLPSIRSRLCTIKWSLTICLMPAAIVWATSSRVNAASAAAILAATNSITAEDAQSFINTLADDSLEGRETGTRGGRAAGAYLGQQFQQFHLRGGGVDGGYYQPFGASSRNLLGWIEGSDPELKKQYVFVTAHYDHVGYGNARTSLGGIGQIHNGADDNASGDAGVLETAKAFTVLGQPPKRSVMFALWDAEEEGLLGSKYWIEHPTVPLASVAAVINVDMIGRLRNNRVLVYGQRTSYGFRQLLARDNDSTGLTLDFDWLMKGDSDHHPFVMAGVPTLMLHTGLHEDYHRPGDKASKINSAGLASVSRLLFRAALDLADEDDRPKFRSASREESPATQPVVERLEPAAPGRLGLTWDEKQAKNGLVQVEAVSAGSAAAKAGLKTGDRIMAYARRPVNEAEQFRLFVLATRGAVPIKVQRGDAADPIELSIKPSGEPVSMGLSWRTDDAEPGSVIVVRVTPGSPADRAGLRLYDRVYEVGGQRFSTSDEFRSLANSLPSPIDFLTETRGQLRHASVERLDVITVDEAKTAQQ
jgi:hypothetical protein